MSDRRSFFRSLALIGAGAATCPGIFIPKFEPVRWKRPSIQKIVIFDRSPVYDLRIPLGISVLAPDGRKCLLSMDARGNMYFTRDAAPNIGRVTLFKDHD